jgi:MFS family permease
LSDKLQRRKPIALFGYFLAAIGKPLIGLATVWQVVFGARLLDRFGAGTRSAPRDALIASSVSEENRGRAFGLEGVGDNAALFWGRYLRCFRSTRFMSVSVPSFISPLFPARSLFFWSCW